MKKNYELSGMSCGGCVKSVQNALLKLPNVEEANVQLHPQSVVITMSENIGTEALQAQLNKVGHYSIRETVTQ